MGLIEQLIEMHVAEAPKAAIPPCTECGACCENYATIDVYVDDPNFDWLEAHGYIEDRLEARDFSMVQEPSSYRCVALEGEVGKDAHCGIYEHRPEGCRKYEVGADRCRTAIFLQITRRGKELFTDDPESWPGRRGNADQSEATAAR